MTEKYHSVTFIDAQGYAQTIPITSGTIHGDTLHLSGWPEHPIQVGPKPTTITINDRYGRITSTLTCRLEADEVGAFFEERIPGQGDVILKVRLEPDWSRSATFIFLVELNMAKPF